MTRDDKRGNNKRINRNSNLERNVQEEIETKNFNKNDKNDAARKNSYFFYEL